MHHWQSYLLLNGVWVSVIRHDGGDVLLLTNHINAPVNVMAPVSLASCVMHYTSVERCNISDLQHDNTQMNMATFTISGVDQFIPTTGIIDMRSPMRFGGKDTMTVLRFKGQLIHDLDRNMWIGNYPAGNFDGMSYIQAYGELIKRSNNAANFEYINQYVAKFYSRGRHVLFCGWSAGVRRH